MKARKTTKLLIKGKRVILRKIKLSDVNERYLSWIVDPHVNQYLETRFERRGLKGLKKYVRDVINDGRIIFLAIIHRRTHQHIGNIKIGPVVLPHRFADIGIIIGDKLFWGRGLGSEALNLAKEYCFGKLKIHKLIAGIYSNNIGSIRAFEKSGFVLEGARKKQYLSGGKYVDTFLFGCLKK